MWRALLVLLRGLRPSSSRMPPPPPERAEVGPAGEWADVVVGERDPGGDLLLLLDESAGASGGRWCTLPSASSLL